MRCNGLGMQQRLKYYQVQARILLQLASTTSDREYAAQLEARARMYLSLADHPVDTPDLPAILDDYNKGQLRGD
jgi:hypothetical protein